MLDAGELLLEDLPHAPLVVGVDVRVDEADGDGFDARACAARRRRVARLGLVQGSEHRAVVVDALGHLEAVAAADVGGGTSL